MQNNVIFSGLFIGQNFISVKEVDSTNNFLKGMLTNSKPLPEGSVIMAENQYAGRGQQQNGWHSQAGKNLTFSLLLMPSFLSLNDQYDLTRVVSLGVIDALKPLLGSQLKIKWPNDIYYADKKLGGILIENIVQAGQIKYAIAGIGLNINQESFPEHLPNPVSMLQILQKDYDLKLLLSDICAKIEGYYLRLKAGKTAEIRKAYVGQLYWYNERKDFKAGGKVFNGMIKGVEDAGSLIVDTKEAELTFKLKEIEFLNK